MYACNVLKKRAEDGGGKRTKYCFPVFAIRLFNHLPEEIRTLPIKTFKEAGTKELLVICTSLFDQWILCRPLDRVCCMNHSDSVYIQPLIGEKTKRKVKAVATLIPVQVAFLRTFPDNTVVNFGGFQESSLVMSWYPMFTMLKLTSQLLLVSLVSFPKRTQC